MAPYLTEIFLKKQFTQSWTKLVDKYAFHAFFTNDSTCQRVKISYPPPPTQIMLFLEVCGSTGFVLKNTKAFTTLKWGEGVAKLSSVG